MRIPTPENEANADAGQLEISRSLRSSKSKPQTPLLVRSPPKRRKRKPCFGSGKVRALVTVTPRLVKKRKTTQDCCGTPSPAQRLRHPTVHEQKACHIVIPEKHCVKLGRIYHQIIPRFLLFSVFLWVARMTLHVPENLTKLWKPPLDLSNRWNLSK